MNDVAHTTLLSGQLALLVPASISTRLGITPGDVLPISLVGDTGLLVTSGNAGHTRQMVVAADIMIRYRNTLRDLGKG